MSHEAERRPGSGEIWFAATEHEFIAADTLTYLAFFKDDERRGRPYETWSGTLGLAPHGNTWRRVDSRGASHAAGEPISTPSVPIRAPHFAVPLAGLGAAERSFVS